MAKDTYLIDLYSKVKGVSKADFNAYITDTQGLNKNFLNSLNNFKSSISSNNWSDDIESLVELTNDEVKKYTKYIQDYLDTVVIPLSSKTEELETRLKKYVNEESKEVIETTPVVDTYFEDAFSDIDIWIKSPSIFRKKVDDYYTPKDEYLSQGTFAIDKMIDDALYFAMQDYNSGKKSSEVINNLKERIDPYFNRSKKITVEKTTQDDSSIGNEIDLEKLKKECYETIKDIHTILGDLDAIARTESKISEIGSTIALLSANHNGFGSTSSEFDGKSSSSLTGLDAAIGTAAFGAASVSGGAFTKSGGSGDGIDGSVARAIEEATKEEDIDESNKETRVHFIRTNTSDATLIESEGEFGLIDAANPSSGIWAESSNNGKDVLNYLQSVGVTHLKFVIASHAHSDHVGGLPDIANSNLVDNTTTFIYKDLSRDSSTYGEIVFGENTGYETTYYNNIGVDWYSFQLLENAKNAFSSKGAVMLETSAHSADKFSALGASYVPTGNKWTDCITFKLGKLTFKILNLPYYSVTDNGKKYLDINTNSLVTIITSTTGKRLWLSGDLNVRSEFETYYAKRIGKVDLYKANHHGYFYSNSYGLLSRIRPFYTVIPNSKGTCGKNVYPAYCYLKSIGSNIFYAGESTVIFTINNSIIASRGADSVSVPDDWYRWVDENPDMRWVYTEGGKLSYGWKRIKDNDFYFDNKGLMVTGWQKINDVWYYFDKTASANQGMMKKNSWIQDDNDWYYLESDGKMKTNDWVQYNGYWYYLGSDGKMATSQWIKSKGEWYYLDSEGKMKSSSWVQDSGSWYYVDSEGKMKKSDWIKDGNEWYYLNGEGKMITNDWIQDNNTWYYLGSNGAMVKNTTMTIDGKSYTFDASGACL